MSARVIRFLHRFHRSQQIIQQLPYSSDIITELEDSRKFSLNSLMALLAILVAPKVLQPVALTLLIYTNNLRLANTCFLHNYPTLSRSLHIIPLLGISCMAGVQLVSAVQSPLLIVFALFLSVLPLVTIAIHFGGWYAATSAPALPVWIGSTWQDLPN